MREIMVHFRSVRDIQDFTALAARQPFPIRVGTDRFQVNATSLMGLVALNCRKPLRLTLECSQEEYDAFCQTFQRFL